MCTRANEPARQEWSGAERRPAGVPKATWMADRWTKGQKSKVCLLSMNKHVMSYHM